MFQIGDIEIHLLSDGTVYADAGGAFGLVPRSMWSRVKQADEDNMLPQVLHCLLVRVGGKTILVETGIGSKDMETLHRIWRIQRPEGTIIDGLAAHGVAPEDVDIVINTHLHGDHCGGNTHLVDGEPVPTFPKAEYWVQRLEYADAAFPNERTRNTYFPENFQPLLESGQLRLLNGETQVAPGMRCVVTRGHTRAHQSIVFEAGDEHALFTADMATYAVHFERLAWVTAYDVEPMENIETKREWRRWAVEGDALLIFPHDPDTPVARLREREDKPGSYRLQQEALPEKS